MRALADGACHPGNMLGVAQGALQMLHALAGGTDIAALGQPVIDQKDGRIDGGKNDCFTNPKPPTAASNNTTMDSSVTTRCRMALPSRRR